VTNPWDEIAEEMWKDRTADWEKRKPLDSSKILQPVVDRVIKILHENKFISDEDAAYHSNGISSDVSAKQNKPSSV